MATDLNRALMAAITQAVTEVMNAYGTERPGRRLEPLDWSMAPGSGALTGYVPVNCPEGEVAIVAAAWSWALDLTLVPAGTNMAGSVTYTGEVEGRRVVIWGVTDRDTWEQPATPPPSWDAQVADAIREVFPPAVAADILRDDAIGPLSYRLRLRCQDTGQSPTDALRGVDAEDRDFCGRAEHPAAFLANRLTGGAW